MNTAELFKERTVFSFEVYPAKKTAPIEVIYEAVDALSQLAPDYISVTYGAGGGSANAAATVEIASLIKNTYGIEAVAHLPGINLTRADVDLLLVRLRARNIKNVLALRGDRRQKDDLPDVGRERLQEGEFDYATELVLYIRDTSMRGSSDRLGWPDRTPFNIIGACYPEVHPEAESAASDLQHLKEKVDAGTNQLVTQLFFDNDAFYRFLDRACAARIEVPIQAGIMPLINARQAAHITALCNPSVPPELRAIIDKYRDDDASFRAAGIDYATRQIADLIEQGVDGIHLYTMNNSETARAITDAVYPLLGR